jgi:hypothetical protein
MQLPKDTKVKEGKPVRSIDCLRMPCPASQVCFPGSRVGHVETEVTKEK